MNRTGIARAVMAIFAAAVIAAGAEGAFALEFSFLVGDVTIVRDGKPSGAGLGGKLVDGDTVITGAGGLAVLSYGDGSEIRVMEKSRVRIGSVTVRDSGSVSVISGAINARFQKLARGSERKVVTPTTVCSVRGTDFLVGVSDGADSRVEMKEGALEVRNPYGSKKLGPSTKARIGLAGLRRKTRMRPKWRHGRRRATRAGRRCRGARGNSKVISAPWVSGARSRPESWENSIPDSPAERPQERRI